MAEVSMTTTPLSRAVMVPFFLEAWRAATGSLPTRALAELLLALLFVETANGQSLQNFNWGNLSATPSAAIDYWRPTWFDADQIAQVSDPAKRARLEDLHARMLAHTAPEAFRAFKSHEEGAASFVALLLKPRMAPLLAAAQSGDATAFAHAVYSTKFCPDVECRDAGPTYDRVRNEIRAAGILPPSAVVASSSNGKKMRGGEVLATAALAALGGYLFWQRYKRARR